MLSIQTLKALTGSRLDEAAILFDNARFTGAAYLCGYALELALKRRIALTLEWEGYPETGNEFKSLLSFKTHDLDVLLKLSGREAAIKGEHSLEWSAVSIWNPEMRYKDSRSMTKSDAATILQSVRALVEAL